MFREMRRKRQLLSDKDCLDIIARGTSGVLAVIGDEGYPYAVPLSYVYVDGKFYFHGAKSGHKLDAIRNNDKVSFCIIDKDQVVQEEFTTYFRSLIVFGRARIMDDEEAIRFAIDKLADRYSPDFKHLKQAAIDREYSAMAMIELEVEHMTGKEAIELVRAKEVR